jgi:PAS domain S-box-containing protein
MELHEVTLLLRTAGFSTLFEGHPDGIFVFTPDGRFVMGNPPMMARVGYTAEQLASMRFRDFLRVEDADRAVAEFDAAAAGVARQYVARGVRADGAIVQSRITHVPFVHRGETVAVFGMATDVGELEAARAEAALDQQLAWKLETRLSAVLGALSDALVFLDGDWRVTYVNRRAEGLLRTTSEALLGRNIWDVFPNAEVSEFGIAYRLARAEQRTITLRDFYRPLGLWLEATAFPTGEGLAVSLRDVTDAETLRRELEAQTAEVIARGTLLDSARDAIIVRDLDSSIRYWNAAASTIYGWDREEALGRKARELLYSHPAPYDAAIEKTLRDGYWSGELRQVDKSGATLLVESSWTLVVDASGHPESVFSVSTDVTEKKRRAELDLRTQRMESLGTLASGIAHDLNNVLTPILMAVQLLTPGEHDPARLEILQSTELAVKRGADMIRQVLSFASGANGRRLPVQITEVLRELETLSRDALPPSIVSRFEVDPELRPLSGDPTQILQVLLNLLTNARDAMPSGGSVTISARNVTLLDDYATTGHVAPPGDYVLVEVEDSGTGMTPEVLGKIFEPFFTTKPVGAGTGLGLSTSIAIIRGHGGFMQAYSEPGHGSVFRVYLRANDTVTAATPAVTADPLDELPRGHGELILIVDDEAAIRVLARQTLEAYGYATAVASNGAEAIELVDSGRSPIALVLTDMAMPVMDGAATAAYLLTHHPELPVITASGLNANGGVARARSAGVRAFLAKPYTTTQLLSAVADALPPHDESAT